MGSAKPHIRLVDPPTNPAAAGVEDNLDAIFLRYASYVAVIGLRILGSRDELDDLVQDVFVHAARGIKNLRDAHAVRAWLATVTVRVARRRLQRRRIRRLLFRSAEPVDAIHFVDHRASPEDRAVLSQVYEVLERLPVDDRIAWTLRHVEGEKLERVALLCGCSLPTAKRRIKRAHEAIGAAAG